MMGHAQNILDTLDGQKCLNCGDRAVRGAKMCMECVSRPDVRIVRFERKPAEEEAPAPASFNQEFKAVLRAAGGTRWVDAAIVDLTEDAVWITAKSPLDAAKVYQCRMWIAGWEVRLVVTATEEPDRFDLLPGSVATLKAYRSAASESSRRYA